MATINYHQLTPEQAYKTYDDYIQTDKDGEALLMLFRYLSTYQSRNRRINYYDQGDTSVASNIHFLQKLMLSYIELRLNAGVNSTEEQNQLKEVFKSYRYMTQHQHADAFLEVLETYKEKVEQIFSERVKEYPLDDLQKLPFVGQLNYEEPAEELLYLSFAPQQKCLKDQMKAALRLIWEAYRTIIENVKWNERMEDIYFEVVRKLADYCLRFKRKAEFQWFSEQINKYVTELNVRELDTKKNPSHVDLTKSSTNDKHVNVRFELVRTAIKLDLYQEAYKLLESILTLKQMRKAIFRTSHMMTYFELLAQVFQKSGNWLYQAFAYYNHFLAFKKKPVQTAEDLKNKAGEMISKVNQLVLRVLVVPLYEQSVTDHKHKEKLTYLFGAKLPTRDELLKIVTEANALDSVSATVRNVFDLLEGDQDLLTISENANKYFTQLKEENPELGLFVNLLEDNLIMKVLKAASNIFTTVKLDTLYSLLVGIKQERVQQNLLYANAHRHLDCRIDFVSGVITFRTHSIQYDSQVLPNLLLQLQQIASLVNNKDNLQQELSQSAQKYLTDSTQQMSSRSKIIRTLNKLSDPQQLEKKARELREKEKQEQESERREDERRRNYEEQKINEMDLKRAKELTNRVKIIQDIIRLKGKRFVTLEIKGEKKKIENITENQLLEIDTAVLSEIKKKFEDDSKKTADDKYVRTFKRVEYTERERRQLMVGNLKEHWEQHLEDDTLKQYEEVHHSKHSINLGLKNKLQQAESFKQEEALALKHQLEEKYQKELIEWRANLTKLFKDQVLKRAEELRLQDIENKIKQAKLDQEEQQNRLKNEGDIKGRQQKWRTDGQTVENPNQQTNLSSEFASQGLQRRTDNQVPTTITPTDSKFQNNRSTPSTVNLNQPLSRNTVVSKPIEQPQPTQTKTFLNTAQGSGSKKEIQQQPVQLQQPTQQPIQQQQPSTTGFKRGGDTTQQQQQQTQGTSFTNIKKSDTQQQPQQQQTQPISQFTRGTNVVAPVVVPQVAQPTNSFRNQGATTNQSQVKPNQPTQSKPTAELKRKQ